MSKVIDKKYIREQRGEGAAHRDTDIIGKRHEQCSYMNYTKPAHPHDEQTVGWCTEKKRLHYISHLESLWAVNAH